MAPVRRPNNTKLLDVMAPIELPPNGRSIKMRTLYVNQLLLLTGTEGSPDLPYKGVMERVTDTHTLYIKCALP